MASTYSTNLKIELQATGENSGTWGTITNTNLGTALEQAIVGYGNPNFATDANLTLTYTDTNAAQAARALVLNVTSTGSLSTTRELVVPTIQKQYIVQNNTSGSQSITVKTSGGTGITVPNGRKAHLYVDGTNVIQMFDFVDINGGAIDGTSIGAASASTGAFTTLTASTPIGVASGGTGLSSGTSGGVLAFTASGTLASSSALALNALVVGGGAGAAPITITTGTGVLTALGVNTGSAGAFTTNNATNTFTAAQTFRAANAVRSEAASTQDAVVVAGRAGGTNSYAVTLTPATLSANQTVTIPNETFTVGFRNIPQSGSAKTANYDLVVGDVGKFIELGASGAITIPDATFAAGDVLSIFNNTSSGATITCTITTAYIAGTDADKASVTLATRGVATILFLSGTVCVISGNVS